MNVPDAAALSDACAKEAIHIPGSIQPHGVVLVVGEDGAIRQASANAASVFGLSPEELRGKCLDRLVPPLADLVGEAVATEVRWRRLSLGRRTLDAFVHLSGKRCVIELESAHVFEHAEFLDYQNRIVTAVT